LYFSLLACFTRARTRAVSRDTNAVVTVLIMRADGMFAAAQKNGTSAYSRWQL
jgi:hypothetical protein